MRYTVRDGIVLKNICDEWLLIAIGNASEHCTYVRHINDTLAWYWQRIAQGIDAEDIIKEAVLYFDAPENLIRKDLEELLHQLCKMDYLLTE